MQFVEVEIVVELPRTDTDAVEKLAGVVPVPVAAMIDGSAWRRSHSIVWPSDLWPSSLVSWNTRAAQMIGMRILLPLPSTLLCLSFAGGFFTTRAPSEDCFRFCCCCCCCCRWCSIKDPLEIITPSLLDMVRFGREKMVVVSFVLISSL